MLWTIALEACPGPPLCWRSYLSQLQKPPRGIGCEPVTDMIQHSAHECDRQKCNAVAAPHHRAFSL